MYPGSMGLCREIYQEGIRIPPLKLDDSVLKLILNNVRTPREREGDLTAQIGACRIGVERVEELVAKYGLARVEANAAALLDHSEELIRAELAGLPRLISRPKTFWTTMASPPNQFASGSRSGPIQRANTYTSISRARHRK